jgi:hypothetical protein
MRNNVRLARSSTGHWQSSQSVKPEFFSEAAKARREEKLVAEEMPFLYGILVGMLRNGEYPAGNEEDVVIEGPQESNTHPSDTFEAQLLERDGIAYTPIPWNEDQAKQRYHHVSHSGITFKNSDTC